MLVWWIEASRDGGRPLTPFSLTILGERNGMNQNQPRMIWKTAWPIKLNRCKID